MQDMPEDGYAIVSSVIRFCSHGLRSKGRSQKTYYNSFIIEIYPQFYFLLKKLSGINLTSIRSVRLIMESSLKVMSKDCL